MVPTEEYTDTRLAHLTFEDGKQAAFSINADTSIQASYLAVEGELGGDASGSYAINKCFSEKMQYYMFAYNQRLILAKLQDFISILDEEYLLRRLQRLPKFDGVNITSIQAWRAFFATLGSHTIVSVSYGARLQLVSPSSILIY